MRLAKSSAFLILSTTTYLLSGPLGACSSDPVSAADAAVTAEASTSDQATPPPPDAAVDASVRMDAAAPDATDGGACSPRGASDVKLVNGVGATAPENKVTVQMVDECQGTTAGLAYSGPRLRFEPTDKANHYFLATSTNPADFYPSASVIYNYPIAGVRNDTDIKLVPRAGRDSAPDLYGSSFDPTKVHFVVQLTQLDLSCDTSGYTVSVTGHPEANVEYTAGGNFNVVPGQTVSGGVRASYAFVSKVNAGTGTVEIVGTKPGCKLASNVLPIPITSNKYPLVAGTVTYLIAVTAR